MLSAENSLFFFHFHAILTVKLLRDLDLINNSN